MLLSPVGKIMPRFWHLLVIIHFDFEYQRLLSNTYILPILVYIILKLATFLICFSSAYFRSDFQPTPFQKYVLSVSKRARLRGGGRRQYCTPLWFNLLGVKPSFPWLWYRAGKGGRVWGVLRKAYKVISYTWPCVSCTL